MAHTRQLNQQLRAHNKAEVPVDARRAAAGGDGGAGGSRKRGPRPSRKEAEENAVRRVRFPVAFDAAI